MRDLTFIEDGNDTYLNEETKLINYEKMKMLATTFAKIHQYQQVACKFDAHPGVVEYLTKVCFSSLTFTFTFFASNSLPF